MKHLIIIAHPDMTSSNANKSWREQAAKMPEKYDLHELYTAYPDWHINVAREQELLLSHDKIIIQFPLFWYSYPPLLKKWFDDVFAYGWAYGSTGGKLKGKEFALAISIGDEASSYEPARAVGFSLSEIITPFKCTLNFVGAKLLPCYFGYGFSYHTDADFVAKRTKEYAEFLAKF